MKRYAKRLSAIIIAGMIALSPEFSLLAFADDYIGEATPCNTISYLSSTGYHIGGATVNTGATPDYYLQFRTYTASEGSANPKVYNETAPTHVNYVPNSNNQYWYYWDCAVNVSEHENQYGNYTTDVYRILNDGTSKYYTTATTYVSPIDISYTYALAPSQSITVNIKNVDALGDSIVDMKSGPENESISYFDNSSNTFTSLSQNADKSWTAVFPGAGQYTLYAKDSSGYEKVRNVTVGNATSNIHIGVAQTSTASSATPTVNAFVWDITDDMSMSIDGACDLGSISTSTDNNAPEPNSPVSSATWPNDNSWHDFAASSYSGSDFANGDYAFVSTWVKATDTAHTNYVYPGGLWTLDWQGVPDSIPDSTAGTSVPADGNWHFVYALVEPNTNLDNSIVCAFEMQGNNLLSAETNGIHYIKIPVGSDLSAGVAIKKWAYGAQTASYFDTGNGTAFTGNSFTVNQNGPVTVFAKDAGGNELVRTYTVSNYDPYAGDSTPPTGSYNLSTAAWTTGNVTINVTATDTQSGVKSITMPGGTVVGGNTCSYTVTDNGTYNFTLTDNAGNTCTYPVTVSNIDRSVSVSYTSSASYTVDPNNTGNPFTAQDITLTNNNTHVGAQVTLQSLASSLSGTNGFTLGAQVEESASGNTTWSEIDNKAMQLTGGASTVLGVLSPGGTGHIKLMGQLGSLRWPSAQGDTGNMQLTFTAVS